MTQTIQTDIEGEILRLSELIENRSEDYQDAIRNANNSEAAFKLAFARAFVTYRMGEEKLSEKTAEAKATLDSESELLTMKAAAAESRFLEEKLRDLRSQLDAVRTLSANVRAIGG